MTEPEFMQARRNHIAQLRARWDSEPLQPLPLGEAHRLLSDEVIEAGIIRSLLDLCAPSEVAIFRFPPQDERGNYLFLDERSLARFLQPVVITELRAGRIAAEGVPPADIAIGKRCKINSDRWEYLVADFQNSSASFGGNVQVVSVIVKQGNLASRGLTIRRKAAGRETVRRWFRDEYMPAFQSRRPPSREDDAVAARAKFGELSP
jgi:hypothetical protein